MLRSSCSYSVCLAAALVSKGPKSWVVGVMLHLVALSVEYSLLKTESGYAYPDSRCRLEWSVGHGGFIGPRGVVHIQEARCRMQA
jgi:hypothetical protein